MEVKTRELSKEAMKVCFRHNNSRWRIITMYSQNIGKSLEHLYEKIKKENEEYLIVGGDLNAKTGCERSPIRTGEMNR